METTRLSEIRKMLGGPPTELGYTVVSPDADELLKVARELIIELDRYRGVMEELALRLLDEVCDPMEVWVTDKEDESTQVNRGQK